MNLGLRFDLRKLLLLRLLLPSQYREHCPSGLISCCLPSLRRPQSQG